MNRYIYRLLVLSVCTCTLHATFNGFDMTMDKPIIGLPMVPDQLYVVADSDPVQEVKPAFVKNRRARYRMPAFVKNRRARYRMPAYRMLQTRQYNNTLFPWATYRMVKRSNKRIENF